MAKEKEIGKVTHYFSKIGVAVVDLRDTLSVSDVIHVKGHTTDFTQEVKSMQIEKDKIETAKKGKSIGLKIDDHARDGDIVYRVEE